MSCDVGEVTESLENQNELWRKWSDWKLGEWAELILNKEFDIIVTYTRFLERKICKPLVNVADRLKKLRGSGQPYLVNVKYSAYVVHFFLGNIFCYTKIYVIIKNIFIEIMNKKSVC